MASNGIQRILNERDRGFSAATVVPIGSTALVFVSGEVGRDATGQIVGGGFEAEARQCLANIGYAVERAGGKFKDVVKITAYLTDLSDYPTYAKVRREAFGDSWPASATVAVKDLLLGAKLEVEAIAVLATGTRAGEG